MVCCVAKQSTKRNNMKLNGIKNRLAVVVIILAVGIAPRAMSSEEVDHRTLSLSADAGTLGLGGTVSLRFSDHFGIRGGFNYFDYDYTGEEEGNEYSLNFHLESIPVGLDYYFSKNGSLRLTAGVLLNKNQFSGTTTGTSVELDGNTYADPDLKVDMEFKPEDISPFLTIGGTIYFGSSKRVGLNLEAGVAYLPGGYDVTLTRNNTVANPANSAIDADLEAERQQIEDSASNFHFYPIIKVGVTVSF
jgi:hypothetical protein